MTKYTEHMAVRELKAMREHLLPHMSVCGTDAYDIAVEALKRQQWIPVTERLPEVFKQVLICLNDGRMFTGCLAERDRMEWEDDEWERDYDLEEAAAWMELPEPYSLDTIEEKVKNQGGGKEVDGEET